MPMRLWTSGLCANPNTARTGMSLVAMSYVGVVGLASVRVGNLSSLSQLGSFFIRGLPHARAVPPLPPPS